MSVDNLLVRKLKTEDAKDISRIYSSITQKSVMTDFKRIIEEIAQKEENACFVAEFQSRVVGFMISHAPAGGFGIEKSAWITMVGVDPKFMGEGIGNRLAEEVFKCYKTRGIKNIYTTVRWFYGDLMSFFKSLGFDKSDFVNLHKVLDD